MIKTSMIPEQVNIPYDQLVAGGQSGNDYMGRGGQESFEPPQSASSEDAPVSQRTFNQVPGPIRTALIGARTKYTDARMADLMAATLQLTKYTSLRIGPMGTCPNMLCLGACKEASCTYKHPLTRIIIDPPAQAAAVATKLKAGYDAYKLAHGG
jgi:hypothetical protein